MSIPSPSLALLSQVRILVVGDIMLDQYWFGDVSRISPEAPVPIVRVTRRESRLGGAANVVRNISTLGGKAGLLGVVGQDKDGDTVERLLDEMGADSYLARDADVNTIVKLRVISRQQQLIRLDFEDPPSQPVLKDKLTRYASVMPKYDLIVMSDYAKGGLVDVATMIQAASAAGKRVLVDPKGNDFKRYAGATMLTPNKAEFTQIAGRSATEDELTAKAQAMRKNLRLEALLLTRSEEGMSLYTANETRHFPAQAREVFDVSGAGDTVIATLALCMGAGLPLTNAVELANKAGGIVVGKLGTATVSYAELFGSGK